MNTKPTKRAIASELRDAADILRYPGTPATAAVKTFLRQAARSLEHGASLNGMLGQPDADNFCYGALLK